MLDTLRGRVWPWIVAAGALALAVLTFGVAAPGCKAEARADITSHTMESINAQRDAADAAPRGRDSVADSLRRGEF